MPFCNHNARDMVVLERTEAGTLIIFCHQCLGDWEFVPMGEMPLCDNWFSCQQAQPKPGNCRELQLA